MSLFANVLPFYILLRENLFKALMINITILNHFSGKHANRYINKKSESWYANIVYNASFNEIIKSLYD